VNHIADILLATGAVGAGLYCFVLARRLARFNDLEKGVGGAVAALASQVDELNGTMEKAKQTSEGSGEALERLTERAEAVSRQLELMMASMHDVQFLADADDPTPSRSAASSSDGPVFHSARIPQKEPT
jgi:hypothetical protein